MLLALAPLAACLFVSPGAAAQTPASGQNPAPAEQQSAGDPKALMMEAAKLNGITGDGIKPWHLKATWTQLDPEGKTTDQGTFEEFWAGPARFKRTCVGSNMSRTEYGSDKGVMQSADSRPLPMDVRGFPHELIAPMPSVGAIEQSDFDLKQIDANGHKLSCLGFRRDPPPGISYCLSESQPLLRIFVSANDSVQVLHNRILRFQDHFIAGDLKIVRSGKPVLTAHVETIELLDPVNDAELVPPADAVPAQQTFAISGGLAVGMIVNKVVPSYPIEARDQHISGTVILKAIIGKDGLIKDLQVVSGHKLLQQSAIDAVRQWRYRPYLLYGEPVEVMTQISVVFNL